MDPAIITHRRRHRAIRPYCQFRTTHQEEETIIKLVDKGEIHVISGGFAGGGESSSARKAHLRSIRSGEVMEVQAVSKLS